MFRGSYAIALVVLILSTGCYQKMGQQPRYDPLEPSGFFTDGMSARPRIPGTVARGELSTDPYFETGMIGGQPGDGFPMPVTAEVMDRGESRFNIYCSQCHGRLGDGNGMIPSRGFRRPPSFHTQPRAIELLRVHHPADRTGDQADDSEDQRGKLCP